MSAAQRRRSARIFGRTLPVSRNSDARMLGPSIPNRTATLDLSDREIHSLMRDDGQRKRSAKRTKQLKVTARSHDGTMSGWALSPSIKSMAVSQGEAGTLLDARWSR